MTYDIDLGFYLFVFFNSELGWISSPFQSAPGSIFGSRYKVVRKNSGLPEPPIFEIFGSGSSSRQIPAPAPLPTPTPAPTPTCPHRPHRRRRPHRLVFLLILVVLVPVILLLLVLLLLLVVVYLVVFLVVVLLLLVVLLLVLVLLLIPKNLNTVGTIKVMIPLGSLKIKLFTEEYKVGVGVGAGAGVGPKKRLWLWLVAPPKKSGSGRLRQP